MKTLCVPLLLLSLASISQGAETSRIADAELSLGGVAIGQAEQDVVRRHGAPRARTDTGEGDLLSYPGLDVHVGIKGHRVLSVASRSAAHCTPRKVCPGMPATVATHACGQPVVAEREDGTFLEYTPAGRTCWLQVSAPKGVIQSLRVVCQP